MVNLQERKATYRTLAMLSRTVLTISRVSAVRTNHKSFVMHLNYSAQSYLHCLLTCIGTLHFSEKKENRSKKRFLYGFSMGGAVVLQLHRKDPLYWDGAVLLSPMCKVLVSDKFQQKEHALLFMLPFRFFLYRVKCY